VGDFEPGTVFLQWWFFGSHNHMLFYPSLLSLLNIYGSQSQDDLLHHNMTGIIYLSPSIDFHVIYLPADSIQTQLENT